MDVHLLNRLIIILGVDAFRHTKILGCHTAETIIGQNIVQKLFLPFFSQYGNINMTSNLCNSTWARPKDERLYLAGE